MVSLHTRLRGFTNGKLRRRWILLSLKGDLNSMNTHTVRRHVEELALRQQIGKYDQVFLTSHRLRILIHQSQFACPRKPPASAEGEADDQPEGFA